MTPEGNDTTRTPEDELLARLYQQGTDRQAARYAADLRCQGRTDTVQRLAERAHRG